MANAKLTVNDETRELHQSKGILDLGNTLGEAWRDSEYSKSSAIKPSRLIICIVAVLKWALTKQ